MIRSEHKNTYHADCFTTFLFQETVAQDVVFKLYKWYSVELKFNIKITGHPAISFMVKLLWCLFEKRNLQRRINYLVKHLLWRFLWKKTNMVVWHNPKYATDNFIAKLYDCLKQTFTQDVSEGSGSFLRSSFLICIDLNLFLSSLYGT